MDKVKLTTNKKQGQVGTEVYQLELLVDIDDEHLTGSLGGWVRCEENIKNPNTNELDGIVLDDAEVGDDAKVYGNAIVKNKVRLLNETIVRDNAIVGGYTIMHNKSIVEDNVIIEANCVLLRNTHLSNDVHIITDRVFDSKILTETPNQITGSKHNIMLIDDRLSIGCVNKPVSYWKEHIREIGIKHEYTEEQILEYIEYLNTLVPD